MVIGRDNLSVMQLSLLEMAAQGRGVGDSGVATFDPLNHWPFCHAWQLGRSVRLDQGGFVLITDPISYGDE